MMRFKWFTDPDNIVYSDVNEFADHFGKETGVQNFRQKLEDFRAAPVKEGILLKGKKRTTVKLFIPDLYFAENKHLKKVGEMNGYSYFILVRISRRRMESAL